MNTAASADPLQSFGAWAADAETCEVTLQARAI